VLQVAAIAERFTGRQLANVLADHNELFGERCLVHASCNHLDQLQVCRHLVPGLQHHLSWDKVKRSNLARATIPHYRRFRSHQTLRGTRGPIRPALLERPDDRGKSQSVTAITPASM